MSRPCFILLYLCVLSFTGCATMTESQCRQANWEDIGRIDGRRGRPQTYISEHVVACEASVKVDESQYAKGWQQGRTDSCRPENGYFVGLRGEVLPLDCPADAFAAFEEQYKKGREVRLIEAERANLREKIAAEKKRVEEDKSVGNHVAQVWNALTGSNPTRHLEDREQELTQQSLALKASAPSYSAASQFESAGPLPIFGAFTGTFMGFGVGHAIQGRYRSSGWMWTVGDVASLTALGVILANACPSVHEKCTSAWPTVAALGFLGFRVWQSVDLWSHASRAMQGYDFAKKSEPAWSLALAPNGMTLSYSFE